MVGKANISFWQWKDLLERVKRLEEKTFRNKKLPITLNQQILALEHLGMLQIIRELNISNVKKAGLLATLLKSDPDNTKKAMEALAKKNDEGQLKNLTNYRYLSNLFEEFELPDTDKVNEIRNKLELPAE